MIAFIIAIAFSILLETSITTLPLTLILILFLAVTRKRNDVFFVAFLAGLFLDILGFGLVGLSSLFFVTMVFIIFQYQKRFEIDTIKFLVLSSFLGSLLYLFVSGYGFSLLQSLVVTIFISISYIVFMRFNLSSSKYI